MGRLAMPSVGARELCNEFRDRSLSEIWPQIAGPLRMIRHDAVDPALIDAAPEIHVFLDLFRNRLRRLDEFAIDIGNVQIAVRRVSEIAGAKPDIP
jgi:hypothetical protein